MGTTKTRPVRLEHGMSNHFFTGRFVLQQFLHAEASFVADIRGRNNISFNHLPLRWIILKIFYQVSNWSGHERNNYIAKS